MLERERESSADKELENASKNSCNHSGDRLGLGLLRLSEHARVIEFKVQGTSELGTAHCALRT